MHFALFWREISGHFVFGAPNTFFGAPNTPFDTLNASSGTPISHLVLPVPILQHLITGVE